jgi:hypothetical protein
MSTSNVSKQDMKQQIIKNLDNFDEEKLISIHQFIARLVGNDLINSLSQDWENGSVNENAVRDAIEDYINPKVDKKKYQ